MLKILTNKNVFKISTNFSSLFFQSEKKCFSWMVTLLCNTFLITRILMNQTQIYFKNDYSNESCSIFKSETVKWHIYSKPHRWRGIIYWNYNNHCCQWMCVNLFCFQLKQNFSITYIMNLSMLNWVKLPQKRFTQISLMEISSYLIIYEKFLNIIINI